MHRAKQIFPHLSRTKLILSSDVESLSLSFSLEGTGGKRRVCESVWRRTRMIMVMDRGIFICEWREKLYVVGRRNVKREGGKAATERKNCNGLVTLFFFFFFYFIFSCAPHLSRGRRRGWENPGPRCFTPPSLLDVPSTLDPPPFSNRCCILAIRYLYYFLPFFFFFKFVSEKKPKNELFLWKWKEGCDRILSFHLYAIF